MAHFNVALFPEDETFAQTCVDLARENLLDQASEYLLGDGALPHITLCQFETKGELVELQTLWLAIQSLQSVPISLKLEHLYIRPGTEIHENNYWVGFAIEKTEALNALQNSVYKQLAHVGIEGKTLPQSYFPHLTWARCNYADPPILTSIPPKNFWKDDYLFAMSLGRSDQNGVYHERIYPFQGEQAAK